MLTYRDVRNIGWEMDACSAVIRWQDHLRVYRLSSQLLSDVMVFEM